MWQRIRAWRGRLPYADPLEQQQAALLQTMELGIVGVALLLFPLSLLGTRPLAAQVVIDVLLLAVAALGVAAVLLVRRGRLQGSALLMAITLVAVLSAMLYGNGLRDGGVILFAFALPIALGGVLAGRRGVITTALASAVGVGLAGLLEHLGAPGAGFTAVSSDNTLPSVVSFAVLAGLLGLFIESLRAQMAGALAARRARERELEALSRRLETTVRERTADLEIALAALEQRAAEAERLLDENTRQRSAIRALSVPVLPVDSRTLVMPLVGELDGPRLDDVQTQALEAVERFGARRLLLDITGVPLVDSYVAQGLLRTLTAARLLGAEVVLVGVRPEVAQAIVGLGLDLSNFPACSDLQSALR
jgi:rsbT co-antagonist protein RsbR